MFVTVILEKREISTISSSVFLHIKLVRVPVVTQPAMHTRLLRFLPVSDWNEETDKTWDV